eukprot:Phypoly_transcript_26703.p1 GENE.Phypoly_transcript_26703~~Phypoly_transcript_26703.p1  ORF type:complete len:154 (+),score=12.39 Phypoly_transcript_26703:33-464(+)
MTTPQAVNALLHHRSVGALSKLQTLIWDRSPWMNDLHVIQLIDSLPSLSYLQCIACPNVTGEFIVVVSVGLEVSLDFLGRGKLRRPTNLSYINAPQIRREREAEREAERETQERGNEIDANEEKSIFTRAAYLVKHVFSHWHW